MKRALIISSGLLLVCQFAFGDISLTDRSSVVRLLAHNAGVLPVVRKIDGRMPTKKELNAANRAKHDGKRSRGVSMLSLHPGTLATGSVVLIDAGGLEYFINTNITFSTSSSASAGDSEASYTGPVAASTMGGGTTMSTLNDAYDGYQTICVSLTGATGPCATGNANYTIYNKNGPASVDSGVPAVPECQNRQYVFGTQNIGGLSVVRKVFVPTNDQFMRWMSFFTNTTASPITLNMITGNNLGSDSNTIIVNSSNGDAVAQTSDLWVTTFQNYSGTTSSDPRLGHILQGAGVPTPVSFISFANGDDNPFWDYAITVNPGQTKAILNFGIGMPSKAAAATQSARLATLPATATQCLSTTELSQIVNFNATADVSIVKTASPPSPLAPSQAFAYSLAVTNAGPGTASSVSVADTLPAGVGFVSASAPVGWSCAEAAGTVTCTNPSLAAGPANVITINATAPATPGTVTNTATVSSAADGNPANDSSSVDVTVALADLAISKTSTPAASMTPGQAMSYTLAVTNNGPGSASSVTVTDPLPAGVTFVSASGTGWTCGQAAGTVTCTIPTLAVGAANPITIAATAPSVPGTITNTATVSSGTTDSNPLNDSSTAVATITPVSDLSITKTTTTTIAYGTQAITYTINTSNAGPTSAPNLTVTDTLPAGAVFVSAGGTGWTCANSAGTVTCTIPSLAVGAGAPITLVMNAPPTSSASTLSNTATIGSSPTGPTSPAPASDPNAANNSSTSSVPLSPSSDVPALSPWMLMLLTLSLGVVAWAVIGRRL